LISKMESLGIKPKDEKYEADETDIRNLRISTRLYNILDGAGIRTVQDLSNTTVRQFSEMRGMGEANLGELMLELESLGIKNQNKSPENPEESTKNMELKIGNLEFSTRLYNVLDRAKITTIGDLSNTTVDEFLKIRDIGEKTFDELMTKMDSLGIKPKPVTETDEELLRTIQKLSNAYKENKKKGIECQELKQSIFELLDKIDKNNSSITGSEHESSDSYTNIEK